MGQSSQVADFTSRHGFVYRQPSGYLQFYRQGVVNLGGAARTNVGTIGLILSVLEVVICAKPKHYRDIPPSGLSVICLYQGLILRVGSVYFQRKGLAVFL